MLLKLIEVKFNQMNLFYSFIDSSSYNVHPLGYESGVYHVKFIDFITHRSNAYNNISSLQMNAVKEGSVLYQKHDLANFFLWT